MPAAYLVYKLYKHLIVVKLEILKHGSSYERMSLHYFKFLVRKLSGLVKYLFIYTDLAYVMQG